jgi:hypothetical protein
MLVTIRHFIWILYTTVYVGFVSVYSMLDVESFASFFRDNHRALFLFNVLALTSAIGTFISSVALWKPQRNVRIIRETRSSNEASTYVPIPSESQQPFLHPPHPQAYQHFQQPQVYHQNPSQVYHYNPSQNYQQMQAPMQPHNTNSDKTTNDRMTERELAHMLNQ